MNSFDLQRFGKHFPPLYKTENYIEIFNKILKVDKEVNTFLTERESYTKFFIESIENKVSIEEYLELINKSTELDEKINELLIKREVYVEDLKEKIKKDINTEDKD